MIVRDGVKAKVKKYLPRRKGRNELNGSLAKALGLMLLCLFASTTTGVAFQLAGSYKISRFQPQDIAKGGFNLLGEPPVVQFLPPVMFDTGDIIGVGGSDLEKADFNGDGLLDVAIMTRADFGFVHFLIGDGNGRLLKDNTLDVGWASGIGSGDFNGDGIRDLAVTESGPNSLTGICPDLRPSTLVFLGTGGQTPGFALNACLPGLATTHSLTDVAVADFNADGKLDLAVGDTGIRAVRLYRGVGDGTFLAPIDARDSSGGLVSFIPVFGPLTTADMNGDGMMDLVGGSVATFFGNGLGQLTFSNTVVGPNLVAYAVGDLNNDGRPDIAGISRAVSGQNSLLIFLNSGNGINYSFSTPIPFPSGGVGWVSLADLNRDGALDIAAISASGNAVRLHLGNGDGTVTAGTTVGVGIEPLRITIGDWNSDNWLDLAVIDRNGIDQSRTWVLEQIPGLPDTTSPTVALTAPTSGSIVSNVVALRANAADNVGVTQISFFDGSQLIGTSAGPVFTVNWNTTTVAQGPHNLSVVAFDAAGNQATSAIVSVQVNNVPTAASVSISGRVLNSNGRGISKATVSLINGNGETITAITNPFGYYRFTEIQAGETYVASVRHKRFAFTPQVLTVLEDLAALDFIAAP